jgi:hypothetical protein
MTRRHRDGAEFILPPPKETSVNRYKYVMLDPSLYAALDAEARKRGYKTRDFILEILRRSMNMH